MFQHCNFDMNHLPQGPYNISDKGFKLFYDIRLKKKSLNANERTSKIEKTICLKFVVVSASKR